MTKLTAIAILMFGLSLAANADIYKWVDDNGNVHYSDTPARDNGVSAERVSHSSVNRPAAASSNGRTDTGVARDSGSREDAEKTQAGEDAQAYYCERAKEIYKSYLGAPRLFRTGEDGQREYLSDEEMAAKIAEAEASVAEWCN